MASVIYLIHGNMTLLCIVRCRFVLCCLQTNWSLRNINSWIHAGTSLVPRPCPDFISQPWRKIGSEIKSGWDLGTRLYMLALVQCLCIKSSTNVVVVVYISAFLVSFHKIKIHKLIYVWWLVMYIHFIYPCLHICTHTNVNWLHIMIISFWMFMAIIV